ncbi:MAG: hypothetical protein ACREA0_25825 [bacterium]
MVRADANELQNTLLDASRFHGSSKKHSRPRPQVWSEGLATG